MAPQAPSPRSTGLSRRERLVRRIAHALAAISGALPLVLFLVNIVQISARPFMGGWIWVNDLSRLLIAWVIMIGAAAAVGLREHLVVDFVVERAPAGLRTVCGILTRLAEVGIGVVLLVSGTVVALERMNIGYIQLGIPTGFPFLGLFMVVFGLLMSVRAPELGPSVAVEGGADS